MSTTPPQIRIKNKYVRCGEENEENEEEENEEEENEEEENEEEENDFEPANELIDVAWIKNEVQTYIREVIVKENSPVRMFIGNVITNFKWFITELVTDFDENDNNGYILPMYHIRDNDNNK